jgi:signal peptidase I
MSIRRPHWFTGFVIPFCLLALAANMVVHSCEAFRVPSGSMEPTLLIGDYIWLDNTHKARTGFGDGSVVIFESVEEAGLKVSKRVVGMPGDTLQMRNGALRRNGRDLSEPYVIHVDPRRSEDPVQRAKMRDWQMPHAATRDTGSYAPDLQSWGPVVVPPDSFFALGDNRDASYDSRYYGFIPFGHVLGQPWLVYFSLVMEPADAAGSSQASGVRWSRIGHRLR